MIESITELERFGPEEIIDLPIKDVLPNISEKAKVYLPPSIPLKNAATFLIPLRELYVSGIVVMEDNKFVGRISARHILQKVLDVGYPQCLKLQVKDAMVGIGSEIKTNFSIREVLELFSNTKFGFCPVTRNETLFGSISTRDFLPIVEKMEIKEPISTISSEIIHIDGKICIENTLRIMMKKKLRKIVIKK